MRNDEEAVENVKGQRRHGEEIHRGDRLTMIAQEGSPSLCRLMTPWCSPHPAQHRSLRKIEAQHLQFTMNPWSSPGAVLRDHAENDLPQFRADTLSSRSGPVSRNPRPIQPETLAVPADNGLRLDEDQRLLPANPQPPQHHPEQLVASNKPGLRMLPFENAELLSKSQVFEEQVAARAKQSRNRDNQEPQRT